MSQPLRVGLFVDLVGEEWPSPSSQIRFFLPWAAAPVEIVDGATIRAMSASSWSRHVDVLVFQRLEAAKDVNADVLSRALREGVPFVMDIDDDFLSLRGLVGHEAAEVPAELLAEYTRRLAQADELWVANEALVSAYDRFCSSVRLRATLPPRLGPAGSSTLGAPLRVLYFGTQTHHRDWDLVDDVMSGAVMDKVAAVTLIGINPTRLGPGVRSVPVPTQVISRYQAFMDFIRRMGPFDVGIAPLVDDDFARGKSGLKLYEYLELGLLPVASPVGPYAWLQEVDRLLAPRGATEWRNSLGHLAAMTPLDRESLLARIRAVADLAERSRVTLQGDLESLRRLRDARADRQGSRPIAQHGTTVGSGQ